MDVEEVVATATLEQLLSFSMDSNLFRGRVAICKHPYLKVPITIASPRVISLLQ